MKTGQSLRVMWTTARKAGWTQGGAQGESQVGGRETLWNCRGKRAIVPDRRKACRVQHLGLLYEEEAKKQVVRQVGSRGKDGRRTAGTRDAGREEMGTP